MRVLENARIVGTSDRNFPGSLGSIAAIPYEPDGVSKGDLQPLRLVSILYSLHLVGRNGPRREIFYFRQNSY